jgi:hypothetical protein
VASGFHNACCAQGHGKNTPYRTNMTTISELSIALSFFKESVLETGSISIISTKLSLQHVITEADPVSQMCFLQTQNNRQCPK